MVDFKSTREEIELQSQVCDRADELGISYDDRMSMMMDLDAVHSNGCSLDWTRLLNAPEFDFKHDVCGIHNKINREDGTLRDCFLPRCAK